MWEISNNVVIFFFCSLDVRWEGKRVGMLTMMEERKEKGEKHAKKEKEDHGPAVSPL